MLIISWTSHLHNQREIDCDHTWVWIFWYPWWTLLSRWCNHHYWHWAHWFWSLATVNILSNYLQTLRISDSVDSEVPFIERTVSYSRLYNSQTYLKWYSDSFLDLQLLNLMTTFAQRGLHFQMIILQFASLWDSIHTLCFLFQALINASTIWALSL